MYQRSLFEFELLPILRSAKMARYLFDCVFTGEFKIDTSSNKRLYEIFEKVLVAEGENSARYSELLGTFDENNPSKMYFSGNNSVINKAPLLRSFEHFWELSGTNITCKPKLRNEFAVFARDFHPYCFISLWAQDKFETPLLSKQLLHRIVLNLDHIGISCDKTPRHSENHIHINGAYPSLESIMACIDGMPAPKGDKYPPDVDRDMSLWGCPSAMLNIFGNCARFLIWKHVNCLTNKKTEIMRNIRESGHLTNKILNAYLLGSLKKTEIMRDICESGRLTNKILNAYLLSLLKKTEIMRNIRESGHLTNKILNAYSLSSLKKIGVCTDFPLSESIKYFSVQNEVSFFYFLMFLWEKIFGPDANSEDSPLALMLINQINLIRSYSVMSASNGLKFFTKYFSSHVRKLDCNNMPIKGLRCTLNSGVKNLQLRVGMQNPETEIPLIFKRTKNEIDKYCGKNGIAKDSIKFSIVYHYNKSKSLDGSAKNFLEKEKRKALANFCNKFFKFAGSSKSLVCAKSVVDRIRDNANNASAQYNERIDLIRSITGVDAAGNEEDVPPEVYAPYLRRLAKMHAAQKMRAETMKNAPAIKPLEKLFHSGEDFEDIITGLRRIDETITFLSYGENDRISHALALGVDPLKWYSKKTVIRISKINYLDNLVWLHAQLTKSGLSEFLPMAIWCEKLAVKIAKELYGGIFELNGSAAIDINSIFDAWKLRRNCPIIWNKILSKDKIEQLRNTDDFELVPDIDKKFNGQRISPESKIFQYYNCSQEFFKEANKCLYLKNDGEVLWDGIFNEEINLKMYINAVRAVQDLKINEYAEKGIILEVCPSSNIYIGGLNSIEEHPVFRWNPPVRSWLDRKFNESKVRKNIINVCINTDDPAIFPTNMENEFMLLKLGAQNLMDESDDIRDIDAWVDSLKEYNEKVFFNTYKPVNVRL